MQCKNKYIRINDADVERVDHPWGGETLMKLCHASDCTAEFNTKTSRTPKAHLRNPNIIMADEEKWRSGGREG